ncbi:MAG: hypothetical protein KAS32_19870 [Candidatus Peribacteraceae bacterium]|nr:hypothetical protein [Candidatus Peribacteraceae bacterium]
MKKKIDIEKLPYLNPQIDKLAKVFEFMFKQMAYDLADYILEEKDYEHVLGILKEKGANSLVRIKLSERSDWPDIEVGGDFFEAVGDGHIDLVCPTELLSTLFDGIDDDEKEKTSKEAVKSDSN